MRTGILGGTFDPIHIAHLHAGETALRQLELDRVVFMPAGAPWQKADRRVTPAEDRLAMTRLAIEGVPGFEVDDREIRRDGPTFTVDTLRSFADEDLFLIVGADAALGLRSWKDPDGVLELSTLVVAPRPGTDSTAVAAFVPEAVFLEMAVLEVSGTEIRALAKAGRAFRFLITPAVHQYISERGLYTQDVEVDSVGGSQDREESS